MSIFFYKALNTSGHIIDGEIDAVDKNDVIRKLKIVQLAPLELTSDQKDEQQELSRKKIAKKDIVHLTAQMASLLTAKLPLAKALNVIKDQASSKDLYSMLDDIYNSVQEGQPFSEALGKYPKHFDGLYCSMVKAGELGGVLEQALTQISEMLEKDEELKARLKSAFTYPLVMLIVMMLSITILLTFVVPRFTGVFESMGSALPWPTQMLVDVSHFCANWWWGILLGIGFLYTCFWFYINSDDGRLVFDCFQLRIPLFGKLIHQVSLSRFALTLSSLIRSGVPLIQGLEATRDIAGNLSISLTLDQIQQEIKAGKSLSEGMKKHRSLFPSLMVGMVGTGEETGNLPEMLENTGHYFNREADSKIKTLTTLIEPVMIVTMGLLVGFIIVAMLLPIFDMTSMVK